MLLHKCKETELYQKTLEQLEHKKPDDMDLYDFITQQTEEAVDIIHGVGIDNDANSTWFYELIRKELNINMSDAQYSVEADLDTFFDNKTDNVEFFNNYIIYEYDSAMQAEMSDVFQRRMEDMCLNIYTHADYIKDKQELDFSHITEAVFSYGIEAMQENPKEAAYLFADSLIPEGIDAEDVFNRLFQEQPMGYDSQDNHLDESVINISFNDCVEPQYDMEHIHKPKNKM